MRYISLLRSLNRKTVFTSSPSISQSLRTARASKSQTVSNLATGEKISKKSIPKTWVNPFATNHALMQPLLFLTNIHLSVMGFWFGGSSVRSHISLSFIDFISSSQASNHCFCWLLGSLKISLYCLGTSNTSMLMDKSALMKCALISLTLISLTIKNGSSSSAHSVIDLLISTGCLYP